SQCCLMVSYDFMYLKRRVRYMFNKKLITLSILAAISLSDVYANISLPQGSAINALSNLQDISSIRI
uniref:hypothetical protein n=1 Tax=Vibrio sp. V02_P2A34T13 TaxID=1982231 RepID=UPI002158CBD5